MIYESARELNNVKEFDVIVCGSGPAGVTAALSAARCGMKTFLIEKNGCLGGILTAGQLPSFIDSAKKGGIVKEIIDDVNKRIEEYGAIKQEVLKLILEEKCLEAGVSMQLNTWLVGALKNNENMLNYIITESKSGRQAWKAKIFIDATGDGDLGFHAGCEYKIGRDENNECQPMTLYCMLSGVNLPDVEEYICNRTTHHQTAKTNMLNLIRKAGIQPSYEQPSLFHLVDDVYYIQMNHEYMVDFRDSAQMTEAIMRARKELNAIVEGIRKLGGVWSEIRLLATAEAIGVREGRRILGQYYITKEDITAGKKHEDGICEVTFCVDVHATNPKNAKGYGTEGITVKPYDIPLRALIARDVDGLLMAGRCISGDFYAHASYRVSGNAATTGEAAGILAAAAVKNNLSPKDVTWEQYLKCKD